MDIRRGSTPMPFRALIIWFALLLVAVANGGFREGVLIPRFGSQAGHIVSTVMLCAGILIVTYVAVPWIHPGSRAETIAIGLAWLVLTLAFEFRFGPDSRGRVVGGGPPVLLPIGVFFVRAARVFARPRLRRPLAHARRPERRARADPLAHAGHELVREGAGGPLRARLEHDEPQR